MSNVITLEGVPKNIAGRETLMNVSLAEESGNIFGYMGPNRAGKTTTIRVMLGLFRIDADEAKIFGVGDSLRLIRHRRRTGTGSDSVIR
ncbi:hypothetical protein ACFLW3_01730 [Chloroflexota bacterium]